MKDGIEDVERVLDDVEKASKASVVAELLGDNPDPEEFDEMMEMVEEFDDDIQEILDRFGVPESGRLSGLLTVQTLSTLVTVENEPN